MIWPVSWPRPGVRTVLDTNVLISALLFRGETAGVHRAILEGRLQPLITDPILKEYLRVLAYPKLQLTESEIKYLFDEDFVNAARVRRGTHLISGDGHILEARERLPVPVLTVRELLDQLGG